MVNVVYKCSAGSWGHPDMKNKELVVTMEYKLSPASTIWALQII